MMDAKQMWKSLDGKQVPPEEDILSFLGLENQILTDALLDAIDIPADVASTSQILQGLRWGLPREFERVRKNIDHPATSSTEASEGFEDLALDEEEFSYAERAAQELHIFKGMITQRLNLLASGAIEELRPALEQRGAV